MLGASVAIADVVYGNTQLVDQNGQPVVKVIVGSTAAASDGVVAANIASKIANEAYKTSTLTATTAGSPVSVSGLVKLDCYRYRLTLTDSAGHTSTTISGELLTPSA